MVFMSLFGQNSLTLLCSINSFLAFPCSNCHATKKREAINISTIAKAQMGVSNLSLCWVKGVESNDCLC